MRPLPWLAGVLHIKLSEMLDGYNWMLGVLNDIAWLSSSARQRPNGENRPGEITCYTSSPVIDLSPSPRWNTTTAFCQKKNETPHAFNVEHLNGTLWKLREGSIM